MKIVGVVCEYNPLHLGHVRQMRAIRDRFGPDCAIVCCMSGNFVQRGHPAIFDKMTRASAALASSADLVIELPLNYALSSAEGFAAGAVSILGKFCDFLSFGAEHPDPDAMMSTAAALHSPEFSGHLRAHLDAGLSFPAARAAALSDMGADAAIVRYPNDILGVEYCKAILSQGSAMAPAPIHRPGSYHAVAPDPENPSATAVRALITKGQDFSPFVPGGAFRDAVPHSLEFGEKAILAKLRTMTDEEFEAVPFGSEGLWRKLMHESRRQRSLEDIAAAVKTKRYTRTRIDRMVMCAFLGLTKEELSSPAPYARVLGFTEAGRAVLRDAREVTPLINIGTRTEDPFWQLEQRCADLYALFAEQPEAPGREAKLRVIRR